MKQQFRKTFILIPVGLFFLTATIALTQFKSMPDLVRGLLFGIGIGLVALPFVLKKVKPGGC
ncbi:hypothetical protein [Ferruginibacter sp.]